ncbi:MAG: hypothetical protein ACXW1S_05260, partial [Acidimicrobiia bacterium]
MFRRRDPRGNDQGFALITVLLATMALMALGTAAVAYGLGSQNASRRDQDWNAALAAAEAGIDDYVFRLNENSNYFQFNGTTNPPSDGNGAFAGWQAVQGPANQSSFHYSVDTSQLTTQGTLTITSSGRSGARNVTRTVQSVLRRRSFIDYLYFTDFETIDPATYPNNSSSATANWAQMNCSQHWADGRPEGSNQCVPINFISADTLNGPVHTNDALLICGTPHFNGKTTSSWNHTPRWRGNGSCSGNGPIVANAGDPAYATPLTMPPSNAALKAEVIAGAGGCLYTGPTSIRLNAAGTMTVDSPFSKNTNNGCPVNTWNGSGGRPAAVTGPLPSNGVVYVQSVPSSSSDVNYTSGCPYSVRFSSGSPTQPLRAHPLGYRVNNDQASSGYGCRDGDVFLSGNLRGQLTIASENNVNAVGNVTYQGGLSGTDLLGLIANNYVQVYHPVSCTSGGTGSGCNITTPAGGGSLSNARIDAAILSLAHSFRVQNWSAGAPLGTLTINGAIAQRYRGAVGTNSGGSVASGYAKAYTYDNRL